jgi:23S rRNA (pseudouridine1915-N3)-methyltransferase
MLVHLICVGKLKDGPFQALERDYLKRLNSLKLEIHEVKDKSDFPDFEATEVIKKIKDLTLNKSYHLVLLAEKGLKFNSPDFSRWLYQKMTEHKTLILVIAGAMGHGKPILELSHEKLSLSELTFPHKLARIVLIEQIYRAMTINQNHPYHN